MTYPDPEPPSFFWGRPTAELIERYLWEPGSAVPRRRVQPDRRYAQGGWVPTPGAEACWTELGWIIDDGISDPQVAIEDRIWTRPAAPADRVARPVQQLCPCGAAPDGQFGMYCSQDCVPNHAGRDTYPAVMRWRADLPVAEDGLLPDGGQALQPLGARERVGRLWRQVFELPGTDLRHLRLDDGTRFVGVDVTVDAGPEREARAWARLERELTDPRQAARSGPPIRQPDEVPCWYLETCTCLLCERVRRNPGAAAMAVLSAQVGIRQDPPWQTLPYDPMPADAPPSRQEVLRQARLARERGSGPRQPQRAPRQIDPPRHRRR